MNDGQADLRVMPVGGMGPERRGALSQTLSIGGTAKTSAPIDGEVINLIATENCFIRIGASPTAVMGDYYVVSNQTYQFPITAGNRVSVIREATDGYLYIACVANSNGRVVSTPIDGLLDTNGDLITDTLDNPITVM